MINRLKGKAIMYMLSCIIVFFGGYYILKSINTVTSSSRQYFISNYSLTHEEISELEKLAMAGDKIAANRLYIYYHYVLRNTEKSIFYMQLAVDNDWDWGSESFLATMKAWRGDDNRNNLDSETTDHDPNHAEPQR